MLHKKVVVAREEADRIIAESREDAKRIIAEAEGIRSDAVSARDQSLKSGYAEGEAKGLAQVTEKLIALDDLRKRFYETAEPEVIKLVVEIAEKIIGRIASQNQELIKSVVRQALEKAIGERITVKLHPEDYAVLMAGEHEFKDIIDRTKRLTFREDDSLSKGGCVLETEVGTIDARMETQLAAIKKALGV